MGWRRGVTRAAVVAVVAGTMLMLVVGPVGATSCVMHEDAAPASILAGEERLAIQAPFDEVYRGAVLASAEDVDTDEREGSATYGQTVVDLEVLGTYGDVSADRARIEMPDPGWMLGYGFEQGATYFVPVRHEPTDVLACEPITRVADDEVDGLLEHLDAPADDTVLTISATAIVVQPAAAVADAGEDGGGVPTWIWVAVVGVLIAGAVGVTALIGRD